MNAETKLYGLMGNPVAGTKSPWIHNFVFEALHINGVYLAFEIDPQQLKQAFEGFKAQGAVGLSVTIPFKESVMPLLDAVDPYAKALGAVNVIHFDKGRAIGYNTDGPGLLSVLKNHDPDLDQKSVLVLGAGGASRGICGALLDEGIQKIGLWNRTVDRAERLASDLNQSFPKNPSISVVADSSNFAVYDVVINTTSVGMEPNIEDVPVSCQFLKPGALVCDIVYKPHETRWITEAKAAGHPVVYGLEMLIEQALLAQQIWNPIGSEQIDFARKELFQSFQRNF